MAFHLQEIVPWGRSFEEYVDMFSLSGEDLRQPILGCGDGPASFNAELTRRQGRCVSLDPLYAFEPEAIRQRIKETYCQVMEQTRANQHEFIWGKIPDVDALGRMRLKAMRTFLEDYPEGKREGRYLAGEAPLLDFPDNHFALGLSSHFLFLYSEHLGLSFHLDTIAELCRVCREVRLFPLLQLGSTPSPHVVPVILHFQGLGYKVEKVIVPYEFQQGGNQMLSITKPLSSDICQG